MSESPSGLIVHFKYIHASRFCGRPVPPAAFTLPSALLMVLFAVALPRISGVAGEAALHGLKIVALAVVAHGVLGMTRQLCPDRPRVAIATIATVAILVTGNAWVSLAAVAGGGVAGALLCRDVGPVAGARVSLRYGPKTGWLLLGLFALFLLALPLAAQMVGGLVAVLDAFFRAGALVFGGGHVVLPLLEDFVVAPGWITNAEFLAGYGAAQAVPGPMFSLSAYLGARIDQDAALLGSAVALGGIFLPGFLLVAGILPLWQAMASRPAAPRVVAGVNAAVVGLLGAALYDPIWTNAVLDPADLAIALVGFVLLATVRSSPLLVVLWCVAASILAAFAL